MLSEREQEIVRLLAVGLTTREVAQALGLSSNTVKAHIQSAERKLDASSRSDVITRARELGLE
jgi:DNA-binding CsgD family transcriptional regulator